MVQRSSTLIVRVRDADGLAHGAALLRARPSPPASPRTRPTCSSRRRRTASLPEFQKPVYDAIRRAATPTSTPRWSRPASCSTSARTTPGSVMKYLRRGSGYYIDVGASELIADGRIKLRSGGIARAHASTPSCSTDGTELPADLVVYATGYGSMNGWAAELISQEVADTVGKVLGARARGRRRTPARGRASCATCGSPPAAGAVVPRRQPAPVAPLLALPALQLKARRWASRRRSTASRRCTTAPEPGRRGPGRTAGALRPDVGSLTEGQGQIGSPRPPLCDDPRVELEETTAARRRRPVRAARPGRASCSASSSSGRAAPRSRCTTGTTPTAPAACSGSTPRRPTRSRRCWARPGSPSGSPTSPRRCRGCSRRGSRSSPGPRSTAGPSGDTRARTLTGCSIVAIVRDADVVPSPAPADQLRAGDVLVAIGSSDGLEQLDPAPVRPSLGAPAWTTSPRC